MTKDTFIATFIVRLPIPKGTGRIETENLLRDHIMESGMWQGNKDVYVREQMHLTPELEIHRAEEARRRFDAVNAAKVAGAELRLKNLPEQIELQRLLAAEKVTATKERLEKKAKARAAKEMRAIKHKKEHEQLLALHDVKVAKRIAWEQKQVERQE